MASSKKSSAARGRRRGGKSVADAITDPTAGILDQYLREYEAFDRHYYADTRWLDRFGRSTVNYPYRGEPENAGAAFNPLMALERH
jgi:hypothetical protein